MATNSSDLCEYCSQVDFDLLDHPSQSDISDLLAHKPVHRRPLERRAPGRSFSDWGWSLGLQSRIDEQAQTCPLCKAIVGIISQNGHVMGKWREDEDPVCIAKIEQCGTISALQKGDEPSKGLSSYESDIELRCVSLCWQLQNEKNLGPGIVEDFQRDGSQSTNLIECLRPCAPGTLQVRPPAGVFMGNLKRDEGLTLSGRKRPGLVDPNLVKEWLADCLENHGGDCGSRDGEHGVNATVDRSISLFRLIDTKSRALMEFENVQISDLRFTALSYVWGGPQKAVLSKDTHQNMMKPGAFTGDEIPRTISDAIDFTASLDIRYLWVDSLCILQDSGSDKATQIGHMSNVYRDALFTIAAAEGQNADAGLPGVTIPRKALQIEVPLPQSDRCAHKSLLTTLNPRKEFYMPPTETGTWGTRGWTLQEHALSRRCVIFMNQQVYWNCRQSRWLEEVHSETRLAKVEWVSMADTSILNQSDDGESLWRTFEVLIRNFKFRNLTHSGDAHDAVSGILAEMEKRTGESFLWGMPVSNFEHSLCWLPYAPYTPAKRTALTTRKVTTLKKHVPFPSWSWLGWGGHHQAITHGIQATTRNIDIAAFVLRNNPLRLERVSYLEVTGTKASLSLEDIPLQVTKLSLSKLQTIPDDQLLCFWAEFLSFGSIQAVGFEDVKGVAQDTKFYASDRLDLLISELLRYEDEEFLPGQDLLGPLPEKGYRVLLNAKNREKVGETEPQRWKEHSGDFHLVRIANELESRVECGNQLIFLEVEETDGVARRVAIGHVNIESWSEAAPQTKLVVLN